MSFKVPSRLAERRITIAVREQPLPHVLDALAKVVGATWIKNERIWEAVEIPSPTAPASNLTPEDVRQLRIAREHEIISFLSELMDRQSLTDDEVDRLVRSQPDHIHGNVSQHVFARLGIRTLSWLTPDELILLFSSPEGITFDRNFLMRTGGDLGAGITELSLGFSNRGRFRIRSTTTLPPKNGLPQTKFEELQL